MSAICFQERGRCCCTTATPIAKPNDPLSRRKSYRNCSVHSQGKARKRLDRTTSSHSPSPRQDKGTQAQTKATAKSSRGTIFLGARKCILKPAASLHEAPLRYGLSLPRCTSCLLWRADKTAHEWTSSMDHWRPDKKWAKLFIERKERRWISPAGYTRSVDRVLQLKHFRNH